MNNGQTIEEAETTGYYVREGFTETANDPQTMNGASFMGVGVSLMYAKREPRFYACVGFNGATWECESSSLSSEKNFQCWYYRDEVNGKQGFTENCPLTGIGFKNTTTKKTLILRVDIEQIKQNRLYGMQKFYSFMQKLSMS